jgi:hypothetical protein
MVKHKLSAMDAKVAWAEESKLGLLFHKYRMTATKPPFTIIAVANHDTAIELLASILIFLITPDLFPVV